mmetsp:Transcript_13648/g.17459  ORF Transcript_13648/g.17459 Transcript_13648/m.17459 type:complete len:141 (+) Transcript_13648:312-734(+)
MMIDSTTNGNQVNLVLPLRITEDHPLTSQKYGFRDLFAFQNLVGFGMTRHLYYLSIFANTIFWVLVILASLVSGSPLSIIGALILCPFFWFMWMLFIRILHELALVILLMPWYSRPALSQDTNNIITTMNPTAARATESV